MSSINNLQNLQALLAQAQSQQSKPLMEFKAGKLNLRGTTVTADERRGKVVVKHGDDGLVHFQWFLRPSNTKELDLTLFPRGPRWERVTECKDGRVYLLIFPDTNRKLFFWMQEVSEENDEKWCKQLNEIIQNPPPAPNGGAAGGNDFMGMFRGMGGALGASSGLSFGSGGGSSQDSSSSSSASSSASGNASAARGQSAAPQQMQAVQRPSRLSAVLHPSRAVPAITALLANEQDAKDVEDLKQYLPSSLRSTDEIKQTLRIPAVQQTLRRFDSILSSAQFMAVMQSFGLRVTGDLGVDAFLSAVEHQAREEEAGKEEEKS